MGIVLGLMGLFFLKEEPSLITQEYAYLWALFSISDALWARLIFGRK